MKFILQDESPTLKENSLYYRKISLLFQNFWLIIDIGYQALAENQLSFRIIRLDWTVCQLEAIKCSPTVQLDFRSTLKISNRKNGQ